MDTSLRSFSLQAAVQALGALEATASPGAARVASLLSPLTGLLTDSPSASSSSAVAAAFAPVTLAASDSGHAGSETGSAADDFRTRDAEVRRVYFLSTLPSAAPPSQQLFLLTSSLSSLLPPLADLLLITLLLACHPPPRPPSSRCGRSAQRRWRPCALWASTPCPG